MKATHPFEPDWAIPLYEHVREVSELRGWDEEDFKMRFAVAYDDPKGYLVAEMIWHLAEPGLLLSEESAEALGRLFGTGPAFWLSLDAMWQSKQAAEA